MKPFSWSFSKLTGYETCPLRHKEVELSRQYVRESEALAYGDKVHKAMEKAMKGGDLPPSMGRFAKWIARLKLVSGEVLVENQYALRIGGLGELVPCAWGDKRTWYRGKADVVILNPPAAMVVDWKTGKRKELGNTQLGLMAQSVRVYYPDVSTVVCTYVYLDDDSEYTEVFTQKDLNELWQELMPRVRKYESACVQDAFPPTPNFLCREYCPVKTCEFHGTTFRR